MKINTNYTDLFKLYVIFIICERHVNKPQHLFWHSFFVSMVLKGVDHQTIHDYIHYPIPKSLSEFFSESFGAISSIASPWKECFIVDEAKDLIEIRTPEYTLLKMKSDGKIIYWHEDGYMTKFFLFLRTVEKLSGLEEYQFSKLEFIDIYNAEASIV